MSATSADKNATVALTRLSPEERQKVIDTAHAEALIDQAGLRTGDTVIVGRGNPVAPPQYRVARIDEVNAQALIQPLDEADTRDPWWICVEFLVVVPATEAG
jgi:hypothetical protein